MRLLTIFLSFFIISEAYAKTQYTIIIDAGSSGSRLHLYKIYTQYPLNNKGIKEILVKKSTPGLASFANQPEQVSQVIKPLLDAARIKMLKEHTNLSSVKLKILATAGMRLLPKDKQQNIYKSALKYIKDNYNFKTIEGKTISGKFEGIFGWLSANYLNHTFENDKTPSVGFIDIGGASIQYVFQTNDKRFPEDMVNFVVNKKSYSVFSKSFLGLGIDQSRYNMNTFENFESCYPKGYVLNDTQKMGSFNYKNCDEIYKTILNKYINLKLIPHNSNRLFYATSGAYYNYKFFNQQNTPENLVQAVQSVCEKPWGEIEKTNPSIPQKYLITYCANGVYLSQLLGSQYLIPKSIHLIVSDKVNNSAIDWTLGAVIFENISHAI